MQVISKYNTGDRFYINRFKDIIGIIVNIKVSMSHEISYELIWWSANSDYTSQWMSETEIDVLCIPVEPTPNPAPTPLTTPGMMLCQKEN